MALIAALVLPLSLPACDLLKEKKPAPPQLVLEKTRFGALSGWADDAHGEALGAFLKSCARIDPQPPERPVGDGGFAGTIGDWKALCAAARAVPVGQPHAVRGFFESRFTPWLATDNGNPEGLFTGYYEAEIRAARTRSARFAVPVYRRPPDLVTVNLGEFRPSWKGEQIAGRLADGKLLPYADRRAITKGALEGRKLELVWTDDPAALFFLHVQGSGRALMDDGSTLRLGYDGTNGHVYKSVGKVLIDRGAASRDEMSMQTIRAWIAANPQESEALLAENPSYVFFRLLDGEGPIGAQGAPLTPGRSLAVDRRFLPLGLPIWLDTSDPLEKGKPLRRLMIAQDTGGAIRGPVRGDVFFGHGPQAEAAAGVMKQPGRYILLLPAGVTPPRS